ncbi:MAG: tetratricopeptide repeat protein [Pirellulales bacterium]|nr:tetratricopeptide repeat protein [Pirellulales bacterium]
MHQNPQLTGTAARSASRPHGHHNALWGTIICLALVALTCGLYGRTFWDNHEFIQYDDHLYLFRNPEVQQGLTWSNLVTAFSPTYVVAANWHPLTMLSHMLDYELFGGVAPWHHLVSVIWHGLDTLLLFWLLQRITSSIWASALVAALFCCHPLHVESVAWASERKDVLSTFFWLATMHAYVSYVRSPARRQSHRWYLAACVLLTLGLLSKPMVVTLPFVLLLLDYWPLARFEVDALLAPDFWRRVRHLCWEKIPFFALIGLFAVITLLAQGSQEAVARLDLLPLDARVVNVLMSYNAYIAKTIWPVGLAVPYPIDARPLTFFQAFMGGVGLVLVTSVIVALRQRYPYWLVGWLWYLGTLIPVIGLVQVGSQSMADRYSYIPLIGIFIGVAYSLRDVARRFPRLTPALAAGCVAWLAWLSVLTYWQVGYWKDTITLFSHSIEVTRRNYPAYVGRATGWMLVATPGKENVEHALHNLTMALKFAPNNGLARHNRGLLLRGEGEPKLAIHDFLTAAEEGHETAKMYWEVGRTYIKLDDFDKAREYLLKARRLSPENYDFVGTLALMELRQGNVREAVKNIQLALKHNPLDAYLSVVLSRVYSLNPEPDLRNGPEAVRLAKFAVENTHSRNALALDTLAAAYAEVGDFDQARHFARKAMERARFDKDEEFAHEIEQHYESYLADRTYRESPRDINLERS